MSVNSFESRSTLVVGEKSYDYFDINKVDGSADLPFSLKVLLENLLRTEDGANITAEDIRTLGQWDPTAEPSKEIQFTPARVIMQDLTGVPCIVDLATMRNAMEQLGQDPGKINPLSPAEMVIDHSVIADCFGHEEAFRQNVELEFERNAERYKFLRWGQDAINNFKIVPPDQGIVHQINIERLARVVFDKEVDGTHVAYCDTCVGTDSHTTMVNGLGVVGWGVGGIEAEAAMLGQPISMLIPRVVGFKLTGKLPEGCTATDLVLTITELLRQHKVVGKFVEFYGEGVSELPLANRATIGNMSPEYGSTIAVFPIDERTTEYLRLTGRDEEQVALVEAYAKAQGLWLDPAAEPRFSEKLELDLGTVIPSIAGPKRPQDRIKLSESKTAFARDVHSYTDDPTKKVPVTLADGTSFEFGHGMLGVAAITSCTNTSNPSVMLGAGLVAKKAADLGLTRKPWVKTTLGPGSKVATEYLAKAGLLSSLEAIDFDVVGYGCTICIGNTGPLVPEVSQAINEHNLTATAVLSGNRNFEGRISPDVKMNYLASPMLVIVYALAGTMDIDLYNEPIGQGKDGQDVYMRDIWPTQAEIDEYEARTVTSDLFKKVYIDVFAGGTEWQ
ncbi:MAG: aconitate hydratase AcnA, partial [Propionibacteriaceae bacterium]